MKKIISWFMEGWDDGYRNPSLMPSNFDEWVTAIIGGLVGFLALLVLIFSVHVIGEILYG